MKRSPVTTSQKASPRPLSLEFGPIPFNPVSHERGKQLFTKMKATLRARFEKEEN